LIANLFYFDLVLPLDLIGVAIFQVSLILGFAKSHHTSSRGLAWSYSHNLYFDFIYCQKEGKL